MSLSAAQSRREGRNGVSILTAPQAPAAFPLLSNRRHLFPSTDTQMLNADYKPNCLQDLQSITQLNTSTLKEFLPKEPSKTKQGIFSNHSGK